MTTHKNVLDLFQLGGRVALVIGGTGYLGAAIAEALAECGATVAVAGRDRERAESAAAKLPRTDQLHFGVKCDLADESSTRLGIDEVAERGGRLDVLVNSTVGHRRVEVNQATQQDFEFALAVTLTGPFIASQQAAIHMRRTGGGSIIHVGSMYGLVGSYPRVFEGIKTPVPPMYHAAKGGLLQLTRYQAVYWAKDKIRVNCLAPGPFPPAMTIEREPEFARRLAENVPLARLGESWELKGAVAFLASDASSYVTGANLVVDGGWTAW